MRLVVPGPGNTGFTFGNFPLKPHDLVGVVQLPFGPAELLPQLAEALLLDVELLLLLFVERHGTFPEIGNGVRRTGSESEKATIDY
jgi:hypothetical protein